MTPKPGFAYIWEYRVRPRRALDFENAYGPKGPWVALFERAPGYQRTELHRDRQANDRYITIDYWESAEKWQDFRESFSAEFEALDAQCEDLTLEEREIARLDPLA
ncbi:MAG: antibiotic biosynthesis monooxygenase [Holophagales bacterium]|nr:antibiotic biosynthesis monooxygenase [Holophagales bacterium]